MTGFNPTAFRAEEKGARMVAIYATVDGEDVFVGSSLNGGGFEATEKIGWITDALEAHYGLKAGGKKKGAKAKAAPAKAAPAKSSTKKAAPAKKAGKGLKKVK